METVQELVPLAKEMMAHKSGRKLVKLYVLGSVLALLGVVLGLVETLCSPFSAASSQQDREAARERKALRSRALLEQGKRLEAALCGRALSNRQHAS
ncbi:G0/G1 switch protein 2 [Manis pentadactyla]|uniref:G0/G1 switch protein 2 n=1 Tax=Manis pentadactyla TaxID=143292 RepID=UPI00187677B7|nr:G0/G1 switch protein 2 [Manis pentadactyla]